MNRYKSADEMPKIEGNRIIIKDLKTGHKLKLTEFYDEETKKTFRIFGWIKREGYDNE